jgi:tetratricopeptide (TPR) repeat protein
MANKKKQKQSRKPLVTRIKDWFTFSFNYMVRDAFRDSFGSNRTETSRWNPNHPQYRFFFSIVVLLAFILMPILSFDYGITWDEPEDRGYFKEVLAYFQTFGEDKRCLDTDLKLHEHLVNYGPFVNLVCAVANEYISPFDIYETRHFIISLFGFLGILFTGLLAKRLGNWQLALFSILFILLTPTIFGHSMNNQKDIPFLSFYIISFYYLIRFLKELPKPSKYSIWMLGISIGILMSIRVGGLLMFVYAGMFAGIQFLIHVSQKKTSWKFGQVFSYIRPLLIVYIIGYIIGIAFWPAALQDPVNHPFNALTNFEKFGFVHIWEIFEGERYYIKDFPWYYLPLSMSITIPLFVLAGLAMYAVLFFVKKGWKTSQWQEAMLFFIFAFPISYIIYKEANVYSSWRHVLFVYPPLVILSAMGWQRLILSLKKPALKWIPTGVMTLLLIWVLRWMITYHPYQYLYYNELTGGTSGAYGHFELDYWCQSPKQAIIYLLEEEGLAKKKAVVASNNDYNTMQYYADKLQENGRELYEAKLALEEARDDREQLKHYQKNGILSTREYNEQLAKVQKRIDDQGKIVSKLRNVTISWRRDSEMHKSAYDYAIWTTRTLDHVQLTEGYFPPKGTIQRIDVEGKPIAAIVKNENESLFEAHRLNKQRQYAEAEKKYQEYIEYDPLEEEAYRGLGLTRLQMGQTRQAVGPLYKAIELCPSNYMAYNFLGFLYSQEQKIDSAEYCFKKCIEYKVNMSGAHDGLGRVYLATNRLQQAKSSFDNAISFGSKSAFTYYNYGEVLYRLNEPKEALNYYGAAIQLDKNMRQANLRIAQILEKLGDKKQAQEYYRRYQGQ